MCNTSRQCRNWKIENIPGKYSCGRQMSAGSSKEPIHHFPMLVATGSFSHKRRLPVKFCIDFNHFKSIVISALIHCKTLKCSFLNNFMLFFHMLPTKI